MGLKGASGIKKKLVGDTHSTTTQRV
jgi:hypothetical protein